MISPKIEEKYTKDFILSADFTFTARTERSGVMIRAVDHENNYVIWLGREKDVGMIGLIKQLGQGQWQGQQLVSENANIPKNKTVNLVVKAEGNNISVSLDGVEVINYTDEDSPIYSGKVGFLHYYGESQMRNLSVTNLSEINETIDDEKKGNSLRQYVYYESSEINDFSDAIFDYYGWENYSNPNLYFEENNLIILSAKDNEKRNGAVSYVRKDFSDSPIEFSAKGKGEEYAISFANTEKYQLSDETADGYLLRVKEEEIILEKWVKGMCQEMGKAYGEFMSEEEYMGFKIETAKKDEAFVIRVFVNGEDIIEAKDTENPITTEGYVSIISYLDELKIKAPEEKELTEKQILGNVVCTKIGSNKIYMDDFRKGVKIYKNESLMLPLRMLATKWGANVLWDDTEKCAKVSYNGNEYVVMYGYSDYFKNNNRVGVRGVIENIDGTMYVPCDFFENEFNKKIIFADSGLVFILDKDADISSLLENNKALEKINIKLQ